MTATDIQLHNECEQQEESSVLARIAEGDQQAVEECIEKYRGLIAYIGRRSMTDAAELEDAVQEVLISVWMNAHRFDRRRGRESTFISTIARRHFIDRHRRRRSRLNTARLNQEAHARLVDNRREEEPDFSGSSLATDLLQKATPRERTVLELMFAHDRTIADTARALDLPVGTVKSIAYRGLDRLRRMRSPMAA